MVADAATAGNVDGAVVAGFVAGPFTLGLPSSTIWSKNRVAPVLNVAVST